MAAEHKVRQFRHHESKEGCIADFLQVNKRRVPQNAAVCAEDTEADDEEYQVDKDAKRQPLDVVEGVLTTVELLVYKQEGYKYDGAVTQRSLCRKP